MMRRAQDVLSLASFVALGVPDGMIGTAWPSMRQSIGAPIGYLGLILLAATAGAAVVSVFVGTLIRRLGVAALLAVAGCCGAVAAAGFALAPGLWLVIGAAILGGAGAGMLDGGLNTAVGLAGRQRLLNLLHGFYGLGAAVGPLIVTAAILTGSWRSAYVVLLAADLALAGLWLLHRLRDPSRSAAAAEATAGQPGQADGWSRRSILVAAAGIAVFFIYTGLEVGAGQWEASFLRGHLRLTATETGLATFGYWAALTAVRVSLALPQRPPPPRVVVRWGSALAVIATAIIWVQPGPAATVAGFVVLGGALAGVFPALVALTPDRVGQRQAQRVIGWQIGAAAVGGAGISALIGLLITAAGLAVLGPAITVLALLLVVAELMLAWLAADAPRLAGEG
jgi:fucose permease